MNMRWPLWKWSSAAEFYFLFLHFLVLFPGIICEAAAENAQFDEIHVCNNMFSEGQPGMDLSFPLNVKTKTGIIFSEIILGIDL